VAPTAALGPERPGTEVELDCDPGLVVLVPPKALLLEVEPPPKPELPLPKEELLPLPNEELPNEVPDEELLPPKDELLPELPEPPPPNDDMLDWANAGAPASKKPAQAKPRTLIREFHRRMIVPLS
jgi:hypothetical protein